MPEALALAAASLIDPGFLGFLALGVGLGMVVAILPGFGGTVGLALTLPFIYGMQAQDGVALMTGLLAVVATADTFPAVLLGIPGSISGQATVVDGYPLAKKGQAARALGAAFAASLFGGLFGAAVLTVALQAARPMILAFGTGELLLLGILGVTMVGVLSGRAIFRALTAAALGLLVGTVGLAPATGVYRFDFGLLYLGGGVPLTVVVVALFAIPEMIDLMGRSGAIAERRTLAGGLGRGLRDAFEHRWLIVRSSLIGTTVGMLPGIGGSVIDWIAYGHAVQSAKDRSRFGHGDIRGVIGPEAANNAKEGGALVPTMIFGIPGSGSTAVFMGGLILLGLEPGLTMVMQSQDVIYTVIWSLALANVLGAGLCIVLARPIASLAQVRFDFLAPVLLALLILAGFQANGVWADIWTLLGIGVLGWLMARHGLSRPAFVIGFVLSGGIERNLYQTLSFYGWSVFERPQFLAILALCAASVVFGMRQARTADRPVERIGREGTLLIAGLAVLGLAAAWSMRDARWLTQLFPTVAGLSLAAFALAALARNRRRAGPVPEAPANAALCSMGWIAALVGLSLLLGYAVGAALFALAFLTARGAGGWGLRLAIAGGLAALALTISATLGVDLPEGALDVTSRLN